MAERRRLASLASNAVTALQTRSVTGLHRDPTAAAIESARLVAEALFASLAEAERRRLAGWSSLLVSSAVDDAARLHAALGASLARIGVALAPELLIAVGMAEPPRSAQGDDGDSRSTRGAGPGIDRNTGRVP